MYRDITRRIKFAIEALFLLTIFCRYQGTRKSASSAVTSDSNAGGKGKKVSPSGIE